MRNFTGDAMKLLIDLSILRHPYCGLGQVAQEYGRFIAGHPGFFPAGCEVTLLLPQAWAGRFGDDVDYLVQKDVWRLAPWMIPRFDVWHSIHQLSAFRPYGKNTRRILTIHDVNFIYEKQGRKRQRYLNRLQKEVDSATEVCFISEFARQDAMRHIDMRGREPHVIREAVRNCTGDPQQRPRAITGERPFLLFIGVLKDKKNIHTLMPMMEHLDGMDLVVAGGGNGEYADNLHQLAAKRKNIVMTGFVSDSERNWLLAHCAGLCFPSLFEGFGRPIIEAMQWGKPVFCSTSTSIPETAGSQAFYFTDFNSVSMARVVTEGLKAFSPKRAEAIKAYAGTFSYEKHFREYMTLYCPDNFKK